MSAGRAPIARGSSSTKVVEIVGFARLCPIELERLEGKAGMLIRLSRSSPRNARSARRKQPPLSTSERLVERVLAAVEEDLRRARSFEGKDTDRGAVFVGEVGSGESRANTTLFIPLSEREGYFPSDSASSTSVASASCSLSSPPSTFRGLGEYGRIELETPFSIDNSSKALIPSATSISAIICDASTTCRLGWRLIVRPTAVRRRSTCLTLTTVRLRARFFSVRLGRALDRVTWKTCATRCLGERRETRDSRERAQVG